MTDIDQALGRHFLERLLAQLTLIWTDVAGLNLSLETVDQHMETAQMVSVSEPTLSFIPKIIATGAVIAIGGPWMLSQLVSYTTSLYTSIPGLVAG